MGAQVAPGTWKQLLCTKLRGNARARRTAAMGKDFAKSSVAPPLPAIELAGGTGQAMAADRGCNANAAQDNVAKKTATRFIAVRRLCGTGAPEDQKALLYAACSRTERLAHGTGARNAALDTQPRNKRQGQAESARECFGATRHSRHRPPTAMPPGWSAGEAAGQANDTKSCAYIRTRRADPKTNLGAAELQGAFSIGEESALRK